MSSPVPVRPASTVAILRDSESGLEVLLVRRNRALAFAGGFWVFPGGAVDDADREQAGDVGEADDACDNAERAARIAASREALEEAGIAPDPEAMSLISHWTTPVPERKRFSTWFFAAAAPGNAEVVIDNDEIHDYQWLTVAGALQRHGQGELSIMPPTYITLRALERYGTVAEALSGERESHCPEVLPTMIPRDDEEGGFLTVYPGDVGYEGGDVKAPGPRHRTVLREGCWHYEYRGMEEMEGLKGYEPLFPGVGVEHHV